MAHPAHDVVGIAPCAVDSGQFEWQLRVPRPYDQVVACERNVPDGVAGLQADGIQVQLMLAVWMQGSVMPVDQQHGARRTAWKQSPHRLRVELDGYEAQPVAAITHALGFQPAQKSFAKAYAPPDLLGSEAGQPGGVLDGDDGNALPTSASGRQKCSPLNLAGVHQIEHFDLQSIEEPVHRFHTQSAAGIKEIRKMALLETGLAGQTASGQFSPADPRPDVCTQSVLQVLDSHVNGVVKMSKAILALWRKSAALV